VTDVVVPDWVKARPIKALTGSAIGQRPSALTTFEVTMTVAEFARRARSRRLEKKARFEAAFERAKQDLRLLEPPFSPVPTPGFKERMTKQDIEQSA